MPPNLEYRGSFRYVDVNALDAAIVEATEQLDIDDFEWMRFVSRRGTTIRVEASVPASIDRYVAAAVLGALARNAVEGCVDCKRGDALVDAFASQSGR